jgi:OmcA/MtrC family decaheme c-type cytochrome
LWLALKDLFNVEEGIMYKKHSCGIAATLALLVVLALSGCSGGNSGVDNAVEQPLVAQTYSEGCVLCHKAGSIADVAVVHSNPTIGPKGQIDSVTIAAGLVTISFRLFESESNQVPLAGVPASSIRFSIAKLVPGTGGNASAWQSYINRVETKAAGIPGNAPNGTPTPDGSTAIQATTQTATTSGGVFTDNGNGTYSYLLSFNITNVTTPLAVPYDATLTHRVAMQVTGNATNAFFDFVPATGGAPTFTRNIAVNVSCNECHIRLGLHGGGRSNVEYCVTCHNPGTSDANSGNTVDFKVMIHKIHYGENMPSISQLGWEYAIWGNGNNKNDYSKVVFPQDVRFPGLEASNCTKCHAAGDASDSTNYLNVPTQQACTSCHDLTSFTSPPPAGLTLHSGGAQADNSDCADCHPASGGTAGISDSHRIPAQIASQKFKYNIVSVTDQNGAAQLNPGDFVKVTFSVTDPTAANAPYNILTDPRFRSAAGGASRLAILIAWDTTDYTNTGSGSTPAQPISINPLSIGPTPATNNGNGTFTVTSTVAIPANVAGSGVVAIEGHPAVETTPGSGVYNLRVPVKNVVQNFAITGSSAVARRTVANITNCNRCHGSLSLHGNNRTDEIQVCVICHNANATDINQRPGVAGADGKLEEAIDFKYMIHAIHAGAVAEDGFRENGIVVYGFGGSINDFSDTRLPSGLDNLRNCTGCHTGTTFAVPLNASVLPTTVLTEANRSNPDDDENITPTASVCSSCHDSVAAKTHMTEQGGQFHYKAFAPAPPTGGGSQVALCGPGPIASQPAGHSTRTDCCSCHGFN